MAERLPYIPPMSISSRREGPAWTGPTLVVVVALALRTAYLIHYSSMPDWTWLTVDNWYHHNWASTIAGGNLLGDTTYFRAPLYAWLLGLLYGLLGDSLWVGRGLGLLLGVAAPLLTLRLGRHVFGPTTGLIAGLLHACYPIAIYFDLELLLDPLFTVLLQISVLALLRWWDEPGTGSAVAVGLAFGLASLARPTALVLAGVALALILLRTTELSRFKQAALAAAGLLIMIAPVTIRNVVVANDPVLIASQGGINFYIGNNDSADGVAAVLPEPYGHNWQLADIVHTAETAVGRPLRPGEVSAYWTDRAIDWIAANPTRFLARYATKVALQFSNEEPSNNRNLADFFARVPLLKWNPLSFGLLLPFVVLAIVTFWSQNRKLRLLVLLVACYVLAASIFFVNARFRLPLLPIYFVLAAGGLSALRQLFRPLQARSLLYILVALLCGLGAYTDVMDSDRKSAPVSLLARGGDAFDQGDLSRALGLYRQAYALDPTYAEVNLGLGVVFLKQGAADSARYYFTREIALHPQRVKGYTNMASLFLVSGDTANAAALAATARQVRPYDAMAWRLALRSATGSGPAKIAALADSAATATGENVYVLNEAAAILSANGLVEAAERLLLRAIAVPPPPVEMNDDAFTSEFATGPRAWKRQQGNSHFQLGFLYGQSGRVGLSVNQSREAIACDSSLIAAWINLASGLVALGERSAADSVYAAAVKRFGKARIDTYLP